MQLQKQAQRTPSAFLTLWYVSRVWSPVSHTVLSESLSPISEIYLSLPALVAALVEKDRPSSESPRMVREKGIHFLVDEYLPHFMDLGVG